MKIQFVKRRYLWEYPWMFLQGLGNIVDGLVMVISLGFFVSSFAITICKWRTLFFFKAEKERLLKMKLKN